MKEENIAGEGMIQRLILFLNLEDDDDAIQGFAKIQKLIWSPFLRARPWTSPWQGNFHFLISFTSNYLFFGKRIFPLPYPSSIIICHWNCCYLNLTSTSNVIPNILPSITYLTLPSSNYLSPSHRIRLEIEGDCEDERLSQNNFQAGNAQPPNLNFCCEDERLARRNVGTDDPFNLVQNQDKVPWHALSRLSIFKMWLLLLHWAAFLGPNFGGCFFVYVPRRGSSAAGSSTLKKTSGDDKLELALILTSVRATLNLYRQDWDWETFEEGGKGTFGGHLWSV